MRPGAVKDYIRASEEKGRQIGVRLEWNEGTRWDQLDFSRQAHEVSEADGVGPPYGFHFNRFRDDSFVVEMAIESALSTRSASSSPSRCSTSTTADAGELQDAPSIRDLVRRARRNPIGTTAAASRSPRCPTRLDRASCIATRTRR